MSAKRKNISPLLGEHPRIVNILLGPVTVHYREVSLYNDLNSNKLVYIVISLIQVLKQGRYIYKEGHVMVRDCSGVCRVEVCGSV